jgi:DNA-binding CsgD family transcriptional regulator
MIENKIAEQRALSVLTAKQREVLDLLLEHKTSKEIARTLAISPHTVDQRIELAKRKLDAASRSELAMTYRRLRAICEPLTHEDSHIASEALPNHKSGTDDANGGTEPDHPKRTQPQETAQPAPDYRVGPEMFEGRHGTLMRIAVIVTLAVLLIILILGGLAMFDQLSQQFAA